MKKLKKNDVGLVIVYYGDGKGKTTAAIGMSMRALGRGMNVAVLQFIKGELGVGRGVTWATGERMFAKTLTKLKTQNSKLKTKEPCGRLVIKALGEGFVGIRGDKQPFSEHRQAAKKALKYAEKVIYSNKYQIVILDEILRAIDEKLITSSYVLRIIKKKPKKMHLVLTGHRLPKSIMKAADLVTEMKKVKHPYDKGVLAKIGVDY